MKILVIGSGGREHALAWKLSKSNHVSQIFVAPGNDGMKNIATCINIDVINNDELLKFAINKKIDLTIVGPEQALINGIVDLFQENGLKIFGPRKAAAIIEGSKQFAKDLMKKYNIPTASYETFTDYNKAVKFVKEKGVPIVIKADGLAKGKGVVVAHNKETAFQALDEMLIKEKFGKKVVIEEFLEGIEFTLMAFVNGTKVFPMEIVQDHKRAFDNDEGDNTGGMGAYSPVNIISESTVSETINNIMIPTAKAMVEENKYFTGILYGGFILTKNGPKVIEFNARFGDPETEVLLPRLNNDLFEIIINIIDGNNVTLQWDKQYTLGVVLASIGYPANYESNHIIYGLDDLKDVFIYHMGTKERESSIYTNGGRVLMVVAKEDNIKEAYKKAYNEIKKIKCDNLYYRKDIGKKNEVRLSL